MHPSSWHGVALRGCLRAAAAATATARDVSLQCECAGSSRLPLASPPLCAPILSPLSPLSPALTSRAPSPRPRPGLHAFPALTDVELKRLKDAFKRTSGLSCYMNQQCFYREVLGDAVPPKVAEALSDVTEIKLLIAVGREKPGALLSDRGIVER
ncbi:hypothetical protein JZ751_011558, partial [Albula glossodonta]